MRFVSFTDSAQDDFAAIAGFVFRESGSAEIADEFIERLIGRCEQIAALGGVLGSARPELLTGLRSIPFKGYVIFFRYREDCMEIVNVLHGSRDIAGFYGD